MEEDIAPITAETTKRLAQLYPSPKEYPQPRDYPSQRDYPQQRGAAGRPEAAGVLDTFFAADFIPAASGMSYGQKYVDYLWQFQSSAGDRQTTWAEQLRRELRTRTEWGRAARERVLALAVLAQAEANAEPDAGFGRSSLAQALWDTVAAHVAGRAAVDEAEVAVELLYLLGHGEKTRRCPDARGVDRVCAAAQLLVMHARQTGVRAQRTRLAHKALLLLEATWRVEVGSEERALQRMTVGGTDRSRDGTTDHELGESDRDRDRTADHELGGEIKSPEARGDRHQARADRLLARDAVRQARALGEKYPALRAEADAVAARLLPLVHPFDGHLTRAALRPRFGPIRAAAAPMPASPSTQMLLAGMLARLPRATSPATPPRAAWATGAVPRAARDSLNAHERAVQAARSDREYGEWWRRLVAARGMPLSLSVGTGADVAVNYDDALRRGAADCEFCGVVEPEDLPALELHLDGRDDAVCWPAVTDPEPGSEPYDMLYASLFSLLPGLSTALVRCIAAWAPAERELPQASFLISVGAPKVSTTTGLGVVKYPRAPSSVPPASANSSDPPDSTSADFPPDVGARLLAQYAQWQAVGNLLMQLLVGLQAGNVLQADYFAQLLMNQDIIRALFWWLGTARLDLCSAMPPSLHNHSFTAHFNALDPEGPGSDSHEADLNPGHVDADSDHATVAGSDDVTPQPPCGWALDGIIACMRSLRRLTSHNGMRKVLLHKNRALYFYGRLLRVPDPRVQQIAAELCRDIMPVVSRRHKPTMLETMSQVYLHAPAGLADVHWLAEYELNPHIEMHRHVELLRLLHFYHHRRFGVRLPRHPALFPSLAAQAIDIPLPPPPPPPQPIAPPPAREPRLRVAKKPSWLRWDSDLEDMLNDVYAAPDVGTSST
ncbi:hypothetical protein GGF46_001477 [Coemansia sp. RSA 552]|nr:hypothetical protein GGF46_001477 [Coemansia sp. RSA 552]